MKRITTVTLLLTLCLALASPAFAYYCPQCKAETSSCSHAYIYDSSHLYKNTESASKELKSSGNTSSKGASTTNKSKTTTKPTTPALMGASAYTFKTAHKATLPGGSTVSYAAGDTVTVTMFVDGNARLINGALIPGTKLTPAR